MYAQEHNIIKYHIIVLVIQIYNEHDLNTNTTFDRVNYKYKSIKITNSLPI